MSRFAHAVLPSLALALALGLTACQSAYYGTLQTVGVGKREILRDQVGDWRDDLQQAKAEVDNTYQLFATVSSSEEELESLYKELDKGATRVAGRVERVTGRTEGTEKIAGDVFQEWATGIGEIQNASLRARSEKSLQASRGRYQSLLDSMRDAEEKMALVGTAFRDRAIYFKHNLTDQAVSELKTSAQDMQREIEPMNRAIGVATAVANEFVSTLPD